MFRPAPALLALVTAAPLLLATPAANASPYAESTAQNACPFQGVPPSDFEDVEGSGVEDAVACVQWYGITQGVTPTRYGPEQHVLRDQMATFLARTLAALRIPLAPAENRFDDVDGNVHEQSVEQLAAAGVITGTGERRYSPRAPITRA